MSRNIKITKGLDIKLKGDAEKVFVEIPPSETVVVKPTDFPGLRPKLAIKVGGEVKAGSPLFFDKDNENILFTSPVSGEVVEINRGEKRKILEVKVLADKEIQYLQFDKANPNDLLRFSEHCTKQNTKELLMGLGISQSKIQWKY